MQIPGRRFSNNDKILTDWAPRGGDNMIIRAERVASTASGGCRVTIRVITKNADESGEGVPIHSSTNPVSFQVLSSDDGVKQLVIQSAVTTTSTQPQGPRQLVRLEIICDNGASNAEWIQVRLFPVIFFNAAS